MMSSYINCEGPDVIIYNLKKCKKLDWLIVACKNLERTTRDAK